MSNGSRGLRELAIFAGAVILGALILKAILDPETRVYRCPVCNLTVLRHTNCCPRCGTNLDWRGVT